MLLIYPAVEALGEASEAEVGAGVHAGPSIAPVIGLKAQSEVQTYPSITIDPPDTVCMLQ